MVDNNHKKKREKGDVLKKNMQRGHKGKKNWH